MFIPIDCPPQQGASLCRRTFLGRAATSALTGLTAAGGIVSAPLCRASKSRRASAAVTFGFSLYGMRSLPVEKALSVCRQIGYDCVELVANKDWPCAPEKLPKRQRGALRRQLDDLNLQLPALMENVRLVADETTHRAHLERLKRAAELGHDLSPKKPPVIETVLGGRPAQWEKVKDQMARRLQDWAKVAEQHRTIIALKAHVGGALHTPHDAVWLMNSAKSPFIRLAYDYSHFQLWGFRLADSLKTMIDRTVFIHVKDSRGKRGAFRFLLPGEGNIDYARYFSLLKRHRYRGPIVVEVSGQIHGQPGYDPVAAAKTSFTNLAPKLKAAGIWQA